MTSLLQGVFLIVYSRGEYISINFLAKIRSVWFISYYAMRENYGVDSSTN